MSPDPLRRITLPDVMQRKLSERCTHPCDCLEHSPPSPPAREPAYHREPLSSPTLYWCAHCGVERTDATNCPGCDAADLAGAVLAYAKERELVLASLRVQVLAALAPPPAPPPAPLPEPRIGRIERDAAIERLREDFTAERISLDEFNERMGTAATARVQSELDALFTDLPKLPKSPRLPQSAPAQPPRRPQPVRRMHHPRLTPLALFWLCWLTLVLLHTVGLFH